MSQIQIFFNVSVLIFSLFLENLLNQFEWDHATVNVQYRCCGKIDEHAIQEDELFLTFPDSLILTGGAPKKNCSSCNKSKPGTYHFFSGKTLFFSCNSLDLGTFTPPTVITGINSFYLCSILCKSRTKNPYYVCFFRKASNWFRFVDRSGKKTTEKLNCFPNLNKLVVELLAYEHEKYFEQFLNQDSELINGHRIPFDDDVVTDLIDSVGGQSRVSVSIFLPGNNTTREKNWVKNIFDALVSKFPSMCLISDHLESYLFPCHFIGFFVIFLLDSFDCMPLSKFDSVDIGSSISLPRFILIFLL